MPPAAPSPDEASAQMPQGTTVRTPTRAVRVPDRPLTLATTRWRALLRGLLLAGAGPAVLTAILVRFMLPEPFVIAGLVYLLPVTAATYFGGRWSGVLAAIASAGLQVAYFGVSQKGLSFSHKVEDYVALGLFFIVAVAIANFLSREHAARIVSETAQRRMGFLAAANEIIARSALDMDKTLNELANVTIPAIADWCVVDLVDENRRLVTRAVGSGKPVRPALVENLMHQPALEMDGANAVAEVVRSGKAMLFQTVDDPTLERIARTKDHMDLLRGLHVRALMVVPLPARGGTIGALTLGSVRVERKYGDEELTLAGDLAVRAATALENVRLYEERDRAAQAMQRSLLPATLPDIPGVQLATRFEPFNELDLIGGDFFDVFEAGPRSWAFVMGDVCGKGSEAAALTGIARNTIRAASLSRSSPSEILGVLNEVIIRNGTDRYCTASYVRLDLMEQSRARLVVSSGGHPSPIVLRSNGSVEEVGETGMLLGIFGDARQTDRALELHEGDAVILYTDGLLDERQSMPELRLLSIITDCAGHDADAIAERLMATATRADVVYDDRAVLVLRLAGDEPEKPESLITWRSTLR